MEARATVVGPVDVAVTLYTHAHAYDLLLPAQRFDERVPAQAIPLFAARVFFTVPDDDALEALTANIATTNPYGPSCNVSHLVVSDALAPAGTAAPSAAELDARQALARSFDGGVNTITAATLRDAEPAPSCEHPYRNLQIVRKAASPYPAVALQRELGGTVIIEVNYDAQGRVVATRVRSGSGWPVLDAAAISAAEKTAYQPEIFRCESLPGYYLYTVEFMR
jgi:TonB family protein